MSGFDEYERYDAIGLAGLIRSGAVSATEVLEASIERIEARNPDLNAVIATRFEHALDEVKRAAPAGPLAGVPFLLKDLNTLFAGLPCTNGSRAFAAFRPARDSELVSRYRRAGLVILGKTNTPELGLNASTEPALFGPTRNPKDPSRSAGGSSGGSACAVASGMLPAAHATDSGGSIRIPASNCGLFGLKPSRIRVPLGHDQPEGVAGYSTVHAVSHSVRDSALLLDISAGALGGDPYSVPAPQRDFASWVGEPLPETRIALCTEGFAGEAIDPACAAAARGGASACEALGCRVDEVAPEVDGVALRAAFDTLISPNIHNVVTAALEQNADSDEPRFEPTTLACAEHGAGFTASQYAAAVALIHRTGRQLGELFARYDALITPTLARPPLPLGRLDMQTHDWPGFCDALLDEIPFTPLYNATGCPAATLPLGHSGDGLPIGVQIGAPVGCEGRILRLASVLERAHPWHDLSVES